MKESQSSYDYKLDLERREFLWFLNAGVITIYGEILINSKTLPYFLNQGSLEQVRIFGIGIWTASLISTIGFWHTNTKERRINKQLKPWKEYFECAEEEFAVPEKNSKEKEKFICYCHDRYDY